MSVDWFDRLTDEQQEDIIRERNERERQEGINGLADAICLSEPCRKCPWFCETAEGFFYNGVDNGNQISVEQMDYLKLQCVGCKGKETGKIDPEHEDRLTKEFNEFREWENGLGMNNWRCLSCPNPYMVYGKYKDPDDEWREVESLCCHCEYWGEAK